MYTLFIGFRKIDVFPTIREAKKFATESELIDYRHEEDGELFSTVAPTLEICRQRRDEWLKNKEGK